MAEYAFVSSMSVMADQSAGYGMHISADGVYLYTMGWNAPVYKYIMSTPGEISSLSFAGVKDIYNSTYAREVNDIFVSPDGLNLYVTTGSKRYVSQFSMTTPHDIASLTRIASFSVAGQMAWMSSMWISPDGTQMFVANTVSGPLGIYKYDLATPWLVSTASYVGFHDLDDGVSSFGVTYIAFNNPGSRLYFSSNTTVRKKDVSPGYSIDGIPLEFSEELDLVAELSLSFYMQGLTINSDETKLYVLGYHSGNKVSQFNITGLPSETSVFWTDFNGQTEIL